MIDSDNHDNLILSMTKNFNVTPHDATKGRHHRKAKGGGSDSSAGLIALGKVDCALLNGGSL